MKKRLLSIILTFSMVFSLFVALPSPSASAAGSAAINSASRLYTLGLFKGTGSNADGSPIFDLDKPATRAQAVVMLVRLLGKEGEAKAGLWTIPFTDVEDWAKPYIGYAYSQGLSNGTGGTVFGSEDLISVSQFLTLILRALGYSSSTDFEWETSYNFSDSIGLTNGSYNSSSGFLRADAALISYNALSQKLKGKGKALLAYLYENGAVSLNAVKDTGLDSLIKSDSGAATPSPVVDTGLSAEKIFEKCSPAVFHIDLYNSDGNKYAQASGFFIDSNGTAVTNYHVIFGAYSAKVKTADGKTYDVLGVCDTDVNNDLAIIKIDGTGFSFLKMGDSDALKTGQKVYALGNPRGLDNTITDGLISQKNREVGNVNYLQISVPITHGSSGGALLDTDGKAVGVTQGGSDSKEAQNLNYAVPINIVKTMKTKPYTALSKGYEMRIQPYSQNSSVPDFGAYSGAMPAHYEVINNNSGFRFYYSKSDATTYYLTSYEGYAYILQKYGFTKLCASGVSGDSTVIGYYYAKDTLRVLFETESYNDEDYFIITVTKLEKNPPLKYEIYSGSMNVPDIGAYFGVKPIKAESSGSSTKIYTYDYAELYNAETSFLSVYSKLISQNAYQYLFEHSANGDGIKSAGYIYNNGKNFVYVGVQADSNGTSFILKTFANYPEVGFSAYPSVPDFSRCFQITPVKTVNDSGIDYYYFSMALIKSVASDVFDVYKDILYRWGFTYMKQYSSDDVPVYSNGTYLVFIYQNEKSRGYAGVAVTKLSI